MSIRTNLTRKVPIVVAFLLTLLWSCHAPKYVTSADYQRYEINEDRPTTAAGADIAQLITPYKTQVDKEMNTVVATLPQPLKKQKIESTLGNWLTDAIADYVENETGRKVDLAICNYGGIRIPMLSAGPLTVGDLYELMPFDNYVVTMELTGSTLKQLLQRIKDYGGWPVSGTLRMEVNNDQIEKALIHQEPLSPDKTYFVALSDYLANGGDRLDFLSVLPHENLNVYYRDALIESAKRQKEIVATIEGRIIFQDQ